MSRVVVVLPFVPITTTIGHRSRPSGPQDRGVDAARDEARQRRSMATTQPRHPGRDRGCERRKRPTPSASREGRTAPGRLHRTCLRRRAERHLNGCWARRGHRWASGSASDARRRLPAVRPDGPGAGSYRGRTVTSSECPASPDDRRPGAGRSGRPAPEPPGQCRNSLSVFALQELPRQGRPLRFSIVRSRL